jgi:hypothetical protein
MVVDPDLQERRRQQGGEIEDWLGHQRKHDEEQRCGRVRV